MTNNRVKQNLTVHVQKSRFVTINNFAFIVNRLEHLITSTCAYQSCLVATEKVKIVSIVRASVVGRNTTSAYNLLSR
ncbi:hypothetical protein T02_5497 [Trichinella nativa]|uniref:Uncharacterized protein n=1 Tax=Trichinella nativa TaxID=6335 RepID=A0A0V1KXY7_9BILA|nr:hypothetical protein T02_5497 [Trichinella nativa]